MAVALMYQQYAHNIEKGLYTCSIFLDMAKAFDSIDHTILLSKLHTYGIRGKPLSLIESYLTNRNQYTFVNGCKSTLSRVETGVPQGSVLGPLFFLLFINDLPKTTCLETTLFADDACLSLGSSSLKELQKSVNNELRNVNRWMQNNRLSLNLDKTFYMLIHKKKYEEELEIKINNVSIQRVTETKYLGIIIDHKLQWKAHIEHVSKKLAKSMWAICRIRDYADLKILNMIYYALAYPHIQYCITTWGGAAKTHLNMLLVKQKRLLRVMLNKPFDEPSKPLFVKMEILPLDGVYRYQVGKLMFDTKNNFIKMPIKLELLEDVHKYGTRSKTNLNYSVPHARTNIGKASFSSCGPTIWNNIPLVIKNNTKVIFKREYKKYVLNS